MCPRYSSRLRSTSSAAWLNASWDATIRSRQLGREPIDDKRGQKYVGLDELFAQLDSAPLFWHGNRAAAEHPLRVLEDDL
jgi:hypothetical protein